MIKDVSEAVVRFYQRLKTSESPAGLNIPHSKVYYARWALFEKTGVLYSVDHMNIAMWLEGYLPPGDITSIPDWYIRDYMGGIRPDMEELRKQVQKRYLEKQKIDLPWNID